MHRRMTETQRPPDPKQRIDASTLLLLDFLDQSNRDSFFDYPFS